MTEYMPFTFTTTNSSSTSQWYTNAVATNVGYPVTPGTAYQPVAYVAAPPAGKPEGVRERTALEWLDAEVDAICRMARL